MFPNSTQKKNWLFASEADLNRIRAKANHAFVEQFGKGMSVRKFITSNYFNISIMFYLIFLKFPGE